MRKKRSFLIKSDLWGWLGWPAVAQRIVFFSRLTSAEKHQLNPIFIKITCCYISTVLFPFSANRRIISFNFPRNLHWNRGATRKETEKKNVCENKFSIKLFSFLSPAFCPILLNGYVADLIQTRYSRIHLWNCFPHSRSSFFSLSLGFDDFSLSFSTIFQRKVSRIVSSALNKLLLFIVVCAVAQSGSLFPSGIKTLSHVIWDKVIRQKVTSHDELTMKSLFNWGLLHNSVEWLTEYTDKVKLYNWTSNKLGAFNLCKNSRFN